MESTQKVAAEKCIEIVRRRRPLTPAEDRLLGSIVRDIRQQFGLEEEDSPSKFSGGPAEWFW